MHASFPMKPNSKLSSMSKKWNKLRIIGLYKNPKFSDITFVKAERDSSKQNKRIEKNHTYRAIKTTTKLLLPNEKKAARNNMTLIIK